MLHHLDSHARFKVMDLIVETIRRTAIDQKRSCGYALYIQILINAKIAKHAYLIDHPHLLLQAEFEDNDVVMDDNDPSSAATRMAPEGAEAEAARNEPPPVPQLRTPTEQIYFLVSSVQGMEKNISEILQNQKSLERIVETKFHDLDVKVTQMSTSVEQLKHELDRVRTPSSTSDDEDFPPRTTLSSPPGLGQLMCQFRRQDRLHQLTHLLQYQVQLKHLQYQLLQL